MRLAALLILLAACSKQEPPKIEADVVIHVTGEGTVQWNGERVRLADVAERLDELHHGAKVVVDGASDADWAHLVWTMALVKRENRPPFRLTRDGRSAVPMVNHHYFFDEIAFGGFHMEITRTDGGTTTYTIGQRSTTRVQQAHDWILEASSLFRLGGIFTVDAQGDVPFRKVHPMLDAISLSDHIRLEVGTELPHFWVMAQEPLPVTAEVFRRWNVTDLAELDLAPLTLPVAKAAQQDKDDDPDARVILNLDREGTILYKREPINFDRLRQALRLSRRTYNRIQRLKEPNNPHAGELELEDGRFVSRLYVLLRADHDLPWSDVLPVVETLEANGYFRLQFATRRYATLDHTPEDATLAGVERIEIVPSGWTGLDCKLQAWLAVEPRPEAAKFLEIEITADEKFRMDGVEFLEVAKLKDAIIRRLRVLDPDRKAYLVGRVRPLPETRFQLVVSAVEAFARAGMEKVDLK